MTRTATAVRRAAAEAARAEATAKLFNEHGKTVCPECRSEETIVEYSPNWLVYRPILVDGNLEFSELEDARSMGSSDFACERCDADVTHLMKHLV